ncbi:hypothetical protein BpHYR1_016304 [Brachionus plicatilis]|uniref:Uncharacterized protein n=1 Tax=Brachionus plicatilis TaxID=10195 RepID=A0A3M7PIG7_BRAPC|nr:hypothetical protein BpHYR1_016304 [Brachionus plicatilis]
MLNSMILVTTCKWPHQPLQNLIHNFLHDLNRCHLSKNHSLLLNLCDQFQNFRDLIPMKFFRLFKNFVISFTNFVLRFNKRIIKDQRISRV